MYAWTASVTSAMYSPELNKQNTAFTDGDLVSRWLCL